MVSMAGLTYPIRVIREQISSALHLMIHLGRATGGRRKIVSIAEITGMEGDAVCLQEIFHMKQQGIGPDGHAKVQFEACGVRPQLLERLSEEGTDLAADLFRRRILAGSNGAAPGSNGAAK
jgi:pilus assembly protein CpaF